MDPLATVGELETHLQRPLDPDRAALAVQLASGAVRAYCGWDLSLSTAATLQVPGNGTIVLTLPTLRLHDVSKVVINGVEVPVTPLDLSWTQRGQLIRLAGWPNLATIEVTCEHGYYDIPDLIKLVVLENAARAIANPEGLTSATVGAVTRTWRTGALGGQPGGLSALDQRLLDRYSI